MVDENEASVVEEETLPESAAAFSARREDRPIPLGAEERQLELSYQQAQNVLEMANLLVKATPKKLGELAFDASEQIEMQACIHQTWKDLRKVSPALLGPRRLSRFGDPENWESVVVEGEVMGKGKLKDPYLRKSVRFTKDGAMGLYYIALCCCSPEMGPQITANAMQREETYIPLVEGLGYWEQFCDDVGLTKRKARKMTTDAERERARAENSSKNSKKSKNDKE